MNPTDRSPVTLAQSTLWRRSRGIERFFCALSDQMEGCGRVIFISRFSGPAKLPEIERALQKVTNACPRARLIIRPLHSGDYEFRIPERPAPAPIEFRTVQDAAEGAMVAAELGQQPFPLGMEPVLRWVVLSSECDETFQIVGLASHGLFDGSSMTILLRRFLEVLDQPDCPAWNWPEPSIPGANWNTLFANFKGFVGHIRRSRPVLKICGGMPPDSDAAATAVVHRWTASDTTRLTEACHRAQTTLTAMLGAAGMFAVRAHYGDDVPGVDVVVPINLRRYLPADVAEHAVGMLVVWQSFAVDFRRPVSMNEEARNIATGLRRFVAGQGPLRFFHAVNLLAPRRLVMRPRGPTCVMTNSLGRLPTPVSPSGVRMLECGWFGNGGARMPAFSQSAATFDDCLAVTSYSSWIAGERTRDLADDVNQRLRRFAGLTAEPAILTPSAAALLTTEST